MKGMAEASKEALKKKYFKCSNDECGQEYGNRATQNYRCTKCYQGYIHYVGENSEKKALNCDGAGTSPEQPEAPRKRKATTTDLQDTYLRLKKTVSFKH